MLSDAYKAAMRERHTPSRVHTGDQEYEGVCQDDAAPWPCDAERLLDALDEAEQRDHQEADKAMKVWDDRLRLTVELNDLHAALRHPSDEVVEAVSAAFARTAAENSELHFEADRTFELAWKDEARAAIAALADALGVGGDE